MRILAAYAVHQSLFHPMYQTQSSTGTGLVRLGRHEAHGWCDTPGAGVPEWRAEALERLEALDPATPDVIEDASGDSVPPATAVSKGAPWYVVFEAVDPFDGVSEIWAGRFMPQTQAFPSSSLSAGVFFTFEGQGVSPDAAGVGPVLTPVRAARSVLFPTFLGRTAATSAAKEQGCALDGDELRTDWPIND